MHTQVYRKLLLHLSVLGAIVSLLVGFYDVIFHFLMECLHLAFEMVESLLDKLVEHTFETELHETQLIVFYILLVIGGVLLYLFWKLAASIFKSASFSVSSEWSVLKSSVVSDWGRLSLAEKTLGISLFIFLNWLVSFFFF